jgi:hypothetical protein
MTKAVRNTFARNKLIPATCQRQRGIALIALMFILALVVTGVILGSLNNNTFQLARNQADSDQLLQAKMALLAYAIGASGAGQRPGDLVRPDILSDANYDGSTDSGCLDTTQPNGLPAISSGANMRCLGRFPWKDLGLSIESPSENDSDGRIPWLAVSANLVDPTCLVSLNSDTLSLPYNGYVCTGESVPHPWLTVRDALGNVLSNRVAAVILIPGPAVGNQSRPVSPNLGGAGQYLDSVTVVDSAGCTAPHVAGTYTNAGLSNEFIMANDVKQVADDDPCYQHPYQFNDKLIYITIEELMAEVEKRAAGEAKKVILKNGPFPDAASIGYQGQSCVAGSPKGFLPMPICNCTSQMCDCAFPGTITYTSTNNFSSPLDRGACVSGGGAVCSCTGAGSCTRTSSPARSFICTNSGTCTSNATFDATHPLKFTPLAPIDTTGLVGTSNCSSGSTATCSGSGTVTTATTCGSLINPSNLPDWFTENGWKHFIYYQTGGGLTVGARSNVSSLLITTGKSITTPITTQARASSNLSDYLDSAENTNGDLVFDAVGTKRTNSYNDQMFIVAP